MRLTLLVSMLSLAASAACSSAGEPASPSLTQQNTTNPTEPGGGDDTSQTDDGKDAGTGEPDPGEADATVPPSKKDAGTTDAAKDATPPGPAAFTKAEIQTLVDDRCAPCHIDFASGGMSLANDFTTTTVDVASTQVPTMKRIAKGDHTKSYLWHKVNGSHSTVGGTGVRMPKGGTALTATELDRLAKYIDAL